MTKIYLDQLGFVNNLVRSCGFLKAIYVRNIEYINKNPYIDDVQIKAMDEKSVARAD